MEIEKCFEQNEDNSTFSVAAIQCTQSQLFSFDSRSLFTRICRMNIFILDNASAHHSTSGCLIRSECKSIWSIQNAICSLGRTAFCICEYVFRCVGGCVCLCTRVCVCVCGCILSIYSSWAPKELQISLCILWRMFIVGLLFYILPSPHIGAHRCQLLHIM